MVQKAYETEVPLKPGAKALLQKLRRAGWRLGVATALERAQYTPCLERLGIYDLFSAFAEVGESRDKAFPDLYLCLLYTSSFACPSPVSALDGS